MLWPLLPTVVQNSFKLCPLVSPVWGLAVRMGTKEMPWHNSSATHQICCLPHAYQSFYRGSIRNPTAHITTSVYCTLKGNARVPETVEILRDWHILTFYPNEYNYQQMQQPKPTSPNKWQYLEPGVPTIKQLTGWNISSCPFHKSFTFEFYWALIYRKQ